MYPKGTAMNNNRLDIELFQRGLCKSRERARQLIKNGNVMTDGTVCIKPSFIINDDTDIQVSGDIHKYVGRGGLKLEKALSYFEISVDGLVCVDIGASTGGFTDCMLQNGAAKVYALDVGHSQLDEFLLNDKRVINMEKMNIRETVISDFNDTINFIATDVSFISLKLVIPKIKELLMPDGESVVLIKPQFEAGKGNINKTGLVKNPHIHRQILNDITQFAKETGFIIAGLCVSPIKGGSGNSEYLMYLKKLSDLLVQSQYKYNIDGLIKEVFTEGRKK